MVRNYVRKKPKTHSEENIYRAQQLIENEGYTIRKASKECGVPYETLRRWINQPPTRFSSRSKHRALTDEEEELIVTGLKAAADCGWPCGTEEVKMMVKTYLDKRCVGNSPFKDNMPGNDWMISFKRRWCDQLTIRKPEVLTVARKKAMSKTTLDEFFKIVKTTMEKNCFLVYSDNQKELSERIYNCDETAVSTNPAGKKVFISKGKRDAYLEAPGAGKACYTVLFCTSASGEFLPPLIVYKARNLYQKWTTGGPIGATYACTCSGWMEDTVFENSVVNSFIPHVKNKEKPVILFYDGHGSHLTFKTAQSCMEEKIIIICLPPHTSHALQPLDVGVFKPLKDHWKKILLQFYRQSKMKSVDKAIFPKLLAQLWLHLSPYNSRSGFKATGLWPLDQSIPAAKVIDNEATRAQDPQPASSQLTESPKKLL